LHHRGPRCLATEPCAGENEKNHRTDYYYNIRDRDRDVYEKGTVKRDLGPMAQGGGKMFSSRTPGERYRCLFHRFYPGEHKRQKPYIVVDFEHGKRTSGSIGFGRRRSMALGSPELLHDCERQKVSPKNGTHQVRGSSDFTHPHRTPERKHSECMRIEKKEKEIYMKGGEGGTSVLYVSVERPLWVGLLRGGRRVGLKATITIDSDLLKGLDGREIPRRSASPQPLNYRGATVL